MIEPLIKDLLEAGVHFGHQTSRWNPKMKRFIFGKKNGIYLVNLEQTADNLTKAREFLRSIGAQGGPVLFVGTKRQAQEIIKEQAIRCRQFYINLRWLGGLLTNFQTIQKSVARLKTLREWREDGTFKKLSKKEVSMLEKELEKHEKVLTGIVEMKRLPKAVVVVDTNREETAVQEANRLGIPVVALLDTNCDPDRISYVIPGNDDALRSIQLVISLLADSVMEGYQSYLAGQHAEAAAKANQAGEQETAPLEIADIPLEVVEAIVPESALNVETAESIAKKKKAPKAKAESKDGKEEVPLG